MNRILLILSFLTVTTYGHSQKYDYIWHFGNPSPNAGVLDFNYPNDSIYTINRVILMRDFKVSICDEDGRLFMATNGRDIVDSTGNIMQNGDSINHGVIRDFYPVDYPLFQGGLVLPHPEKDSLFQVFHLWLDTGNNSLQVEKMYLTTINKNLNNGKGRVIQKNIPILEDTLFVGGINACKHANGIDWWIIQPEQYTNGFYRFLLTKDSLYGPYYQQIGQAYPAPRDWTTSFSPDGTKYATYSPFYDLNLYDFNRCTGLFSNYTNIEIQDTADTFSAGVNGVTFSPSSQYLYVPSLFLVYQFDMQASNIAASKDTVAIHDGSYYNSPLQPNMFYIATLAPNGKIYINTGTSPYLHVIHHPDSAGMACNLVQHELFVPKGIGRGLPNFPHYRMPALPSGACDTITAVAVIEEEQQVLLYPNPNEGQFNLKWNVPNGKKGALSIYNSLGQLVYEQELSNPRGQTTITLNQFMTGIYYCRVVFDEEQVYENKLILID